MDVILRIPKNRALHTWWTTCTEEERSDALDLAATWMVTQRRSGAARCEDGGRCTVAAPSCGEVPLAERLIDAQELEALVSNTVPCELDGTDQTDEHIMVVGDKRVLIAVKDMACLRTKPHIEEFRKRVYTKGCAKEIEAALLLSMRSRLPNVPGCCHISHIRAEETIPVLMISTRSRCSIQVAIHAMLELISSRSLVSSSSEEHLTKEADALRRFLDPLLAQIRVRETAIQTRIEMLQTMLDAALSERQQHRDNMFNLYKLSEIVPWVSNDAHDEETTMNHAMDIVNQALKHDDAPKTSKMSQAQRQVIKSAGGIKAVTEALRKRSHQVEGPSGEW